MKTAKGPEGDKPFNPVQPDKYQKTPRSFAINHDEILGRADASAFSEKVASFFMANRNQDSVFVEMIDTTFFDGIHYRLLTFHVERMNQRIKNLSGTIILRVYDLPAKKILRLRKLRIHKSLTKANKFSQRLMNATLTQTRVYPLETGEFGLENRNQPGDLTLSASEWVDLINGCLHSK